MGVGAEFSRSVGLSTITIITINHQRSSYHFKAANLERPLPHWRGY